MFAVRRVAQAAPASFALLVCSAALHLPDFIVFVVSLHGCFVRCVAGYCLAGSGSMKYVVVTGGVISGLGKGISISSLGALFKASGKHITAIKIVRPMWLGWLVGTPMLQTPHLVNLLTRIHTSTVMPEPCHHSSTVRCSCSTTAVKRVRGYGRCTWWGKCRDSCGR